MEGRSATRRRFSDEEVGKIIELASRLDGAGRPDEGLELADVKRIAAELGISEQAVSRAVVGHRVEHRVSRWRRRRRRISDLLLRAHTLLYATSMAGLTAIDLVGGGGIDFVHYPFFGWGIVLAWHGGLMWLVRPRSG